MSRAFLKDDAVQDAVLIPPRAPLPAGTPNLVTMEGLAKLQAEREALEAERSRVLSRKAPEQDRTRSLNEITGRLRLLDDRIGSAKVVRPSDQPAGEVRFSARVRVRTVRGARQGLVRGFRLVGVDEADPSAGLVAFTAPIARAITGLQVGESASFGTPAGEEVLVVEDIAYDG